VVKQQFYARKHAGVLSDEEREAYSRHMDQVLDSIHKRDYARTSKLRAAWIERLMEEARR
jgi:hypothetical protein